MACSTSLYITLGSIIGSLLILIIAHYTGTWGAFVEFMTWLRSAWNWFLATVPNFAKGLIFIFLLLFIFDFAVGGVLGVMFSCTSSDDLRQPTGIWAGVGMTFECGLNQADNITDAEYDAYVLNHTVPLQDYSDDSEAESIMRVQCNGGDPRLTLYNIDFLNYRYWLIIMIIAGLIGFMFKIK